MSIEAHLALLVAVPILAQAGHLPGGYLECDAQDGRAVLHVVAGSLLVVQDLHDLVLRPETETHRITTEVTHCPSLRGSNDMRCQWFLSKPHSQSSSSSWPGPIVMSSQ